jgi:HPt (histidine-containing phosphotransfer) domain-containing protein
LAEDEDPADAPLVDDGKIDELRSLLGDGEDGVDGLIDTFVDRIPEAIEDIRAAAEAGEIEELGRLAHQIKGESATLGAMRLSLSAKRVEKAASADELEDPHGAADELASIYEETEAALETA